MTEAWLRVGEVARRTGLTVRTLHHYDALGLLVPSGRSAGDYRLYSEADLRRLLAIQHLKGLGMSLDDIAAALDDPAFDAAAALDRQIADVQARIAAERELLTRLRALRGASLAGWAEVVEVIALTERLRHPEPSVRVRAALDVPETLPVENLVGLLTDEREPAVRETLTWAVARHGTAAVPAVVAGLGHRDPVVRAQFLHALSKIGDPDAAGAVAALLDDPEPEVAAKAAFALGQLGGAVAVDALVAALGAHPDEVRDAVTDALARLGAPAVPGALTALRAPDARVRAQAADILGLIGEPDALTPLAAALHDADAGVRFAALVALGQFDDPRARDAIAGVAESGDARVRTLATRLLAGAAGSLRRP